ncbi:Nodule Cysteine-Rich (NCR) secreted peptide [Medicago truncatula]|uniref:Nodule Cysteine-Rich (NCR) secreted peptide n=1 Tax=Medicago truncatula TaxID=3880 RepID=A0A072VAQ2_MEDTR|nr:Nodule Cysteine-Rich (NCR) secreted peptide [Medicago truncatula]
MAKIVKFVYVTIIFLYMFHVSTNIEGDELHTFFILRARLMACTYETLSQMGPLEIQ